MVWARKVQRRLVVLAEFETLLISVFHFHFDIALFMDFL
jgi:hypothetical protein